jgi:metallo-beta-lactamase class B
MRLCATACSAIAMLTASALAPVAVAAPNPEADALIKQAFTMVEPRFEPAFERNCSTDAPFPLANGHGGPAVPAKLFDNFYYVGRTDVGAWLLKTSDGLVLIDTLYSSDEAQKVIIGDIRKLGFDPDQIKLVLITHGHIDHAGGWKYFNQKGIKVMLGEVDWGLLGGAPGPDNILHDGQVLTVGDTSITAVFTPGHTPGTFTFLFPVFERGKKHMAALTGGVGPRGGIPVHQRSIAGMEHLLELGRGVGLDVLFLPHEAFEDPIGMQAILDAPTRKPGTPNAFILGQDRLQAYGRMLETCWKARIAIMKIGNGEVGRGPGAPGS